MLQNCIKCETMLFTNANILGYWSGKKQKQLWQMKKSSYILFESLGLPKKGWYISDTVQ